MTIAIVVEKSIMKNSAILKIKKPFFLVKPAVLLHCDGSETNLTLGDEIARWVQGYEKLAIMGIGNPLRRDDGVGVEIVEQLTGKVPERVKLFSCEMVPENFLSDIKVFQPTHVLIIDTAELKAEPGEARLIPPQKIGGTTFSSHTIPLSLLAGMIDETVKAKIIFLGIQPFSTGFGEELSPELQMATEKTVKTISEALKEIE